MDLAIKKTALQHAESVEAVLNWKLEELQNSNLPIETGLCDYIALALEGQDDEIKKLEEYKKKIDEAISELKTNRDKNREDVYQWLQKTGLDKLKGIHVSSITCKPESVSVTKRFIKECTNDELVEKGLGYYEENIKTIAQTIKINKKRSK